MRCATAAEGPAKRHGDAELRGLCGSGLVDVVSELVRVGLLDATGRLVPDDVAAELFSLSLQGILRFERAGSTVVLETPWSEP